MEFEEQAGHYFRGRESVLRNLTAFLGSSTDSKTRIVTGRPGAGKSAILGRLVAAAEVGDGEFPPVDLAIHAKGKSANQVAQRMAGLLNVEANEESILTGFRRLETPVRIVVDALDEAAQPAAIAQRLLRPLGAIPTVKLVVGTRAEQLPLFRDAEVIDIDLPKNVRLGDVADYVEARLLEGEASPYLGRADLARAAARHVADAAYPNYLVARLITEDLLSRATPAPEASVPRPHFPSTVAGAFEGYLSRFGEDQPAVRDLLLPLAFAEGEGLPWDNIWAPVATALSGREYSDADIRWLLEKAGAFILEVADNGRSVYRLYHQALADALRKEKRERTVHEAFCDALRKATPARTDSVDPDWLVASRYTLRYLAAHAARCGRLPGLMEDPLYLLAADAGRLLAVLAVHGADATREIFNVYRQRYIISAASHQEQRQRASLWRRASAG